MKVEIWSDVMCPFCYIGKRKFEEALDSFENKTDVEVVWKSFQLNPDMVTDPTKNINDYLAESKGWSKEQVTQVQQHVVNMAREAGLDFHFDKAVLANSFDAHRFIQFAKSKGKGSEAEEALFRAYFTDGENTDNHDVIAKIAERIGLDVTQTYNVLRSGAFSENVASDIYEARQIGVRGVPYFVFNDKYAVSGAQPSDVFLGALRQAYSEAMPKSESVTDANSCDLEGNCT